MHRQLPAWGACTQSCNRTLQTVQHPERLWSCLLSLFVQGWRLPLQGVSRAPDRQSCARSGAHILNCHRHCSALRTHYRHVLSSKLGTYRFASASNTVILATDAL